MSDPQSEAHHTKLLAIGAAVAALLALAFAAVSVVLVLDARDDAGSSRDQSRKTAKTVKSLQEEISSLKASLEEQAKAEAAARRAEPAPAHMDAVDTAHDCVLRPGDPKGLSDCIKAGG